MIIQYVQGQAPLKYQHEGCTLRFAQVTLVLAGLLGAVEVKAQASGNPNSDYAVCHAGSPPGWCQATCGPSDTWCEFAGWICEWDDPYFLMDSGIKPGTDEMWFEQDHLGWLSDGDASRAYGYCYGVAFGICVATNPPLTCLTSIDDSDLALQWADVHCINASGNPLSCHERSY